MTNLPLSLAVSSVAGALTLLRPADWSLRTRRAFVLGPGVLAAAGVAAAFFRATRTPPSDPADGDGPADDGGGGPGAEDAGSALRPVVACTALAVGAGLTVAGAQALSLKMDAAMEHWLADRGVAVPRVWMAAAVALASLAADLPAGRDNRPATAPLAPPPAA